jgi:hypothetical protein
MTVWIHNSANEPSVLLVNRRLLGRTGRDRPGLHSRRLVNDKKDSPG